MTNYCVFKLKFTTDPENDSFNQIYQTYMNWKVFARLNGEAFTSEELKNINTGEGRTTLTVTDEKLIAAFTTAWNYCHIVLINHLSTALFTVHLIYQSVFY